jgi:hypothetical protein
VPNDFIDLTYDEIITTTDKAILFRFGDNEVWLPKSQIEDPDELNDHGGEVSVQYWLIEEKSLEGYMS